MICASSYPCQFVLGFQFHDDAAEADQIRDEDCLQWLPFVQNLKLLTVFPNVAQ